MLKPWIDFVVTKKNFAAVLQEIASERMKSFDTETTGVSPYLGDRLFSAIFGVEGHSYYFNFQDYNTDLLWQHHPDHVLPREWLPELSYAFQNGLTFAHNAKFDWHISELEGIEIKELWCTQTGARIEYNDHLQYSLDKCAERIGEKKDDAVEDYIKKHKLWQWKTIPGKKKRFKDKFYNLVPFPIIAPYGLTDANVTRALGVHQVTTLDSMDRSRPQNRPPINDIMKMEKDVTQVCQEIEKTGVLINLDYCVEAVEHETKNLNRLEDQFEELTGLQFKDSSKVLQLAFENCGHEITTFTEKGNPSFSDEALKEYDSPVAGIVKDWRLADKRANTYFRNYLYFSDDEGVIHANMNQGGTATGRFSYSDPNLQNIPKEEKGDYPTRRAFVPRDGYCFVAIDYKQMEFRLMLDYANEKELIERIANGHDPHTATSELVGIERRPAKILNFGLLYGMGIALLAKTLGITKKQARDFKAAYFSGLPKVREFLQRCSSNAEQRGFVYSWAGRIFNFSDPRFAYKAANAIIQGGCADIVKRAMIELSDFLADKKSRMLIQIHDEILFEVQHTELHIVPELKRIMESIYPYKRLPMECSVDHSWKSFGDLVEGEPRVEGHRLGA